MGVLDWLKKKIKNSSSSSTTKKLKEANRTSYYGGGVSTKATQTQVKASTSAAKAKKKEEQKKAQEQKQAQVTSAFKSGADKAKKIAQTKGAVEEREEKPDVFNKKNAFKATPPSPRRSTALGGISEYDINRRLSQKAAADANRKEKLRAAEKLKPLIDEKYSTRKSGAPAYAKQGNYAADPDVAKYNVLKHPYATSATRGAVSGSTFGLSELAISKLSKGEAKEAEKFYQANKSRGAETLGELGGALISFGGTSSMTDKLGEKAVKKFAPNAAERLAEKQFLKNSARRLVKRGVETKVIGGTTEELVKQVGKDKAKKIVGALGNDIVQNLTTGAIYDVNKASAQYEVGSKEWWKELGKSALFNFAITGGIAGKSAFTGGRQLVEDAADTVAKRLDFRSNFRPAGNVEPQRLLPRIGESIDDRIARVDKLNLRGDRVSIDDLVRKSAKNADDSAERVNIRDMVSRNIDGKINRTDGARLISKANEADEALNRAAMIRSAYGDIRNRVLPPSEINMSNVNPLPKSPNVDPSITSARGNMVGLARNEGRSLNERLFSNAAERNPRGNVERPLDSLTRNRTSVDKRIAEIDRELNNVSDAIERARGVAPREELALIDKFDELMAERNTLEERLNRMKPAPKVEPPKTEEPKTDVLETYKNNRLKENPDAVFDESRVAEKPSVKPEETDAVKAYEESQKKTYTVEVTSKKGRTRKVTVEARSEAEALDEAYKNKNVKTAKNATLAETTEEKRARMMTEADEKNDAIRAALAGEEPKAPAKGTKPAAETLTPKTEAKAEPPKTQAAEQEPKNINLDDNVGKKRVKKTFREQFHELASSAKTKISDSLNAFEESNKQYIKSDHQKWLENVGAIDKTRRYNAIATRSIGEGQVNWNGDRISGTRDVIINGEKHTIENGKSLKAIYDGMDEATEKDFEKYLLLKHAPDRIAAGKPIFAGTQYDSAEACEKAAQELLKKHKDFAVRAEELYQYTRNELQNRVDAGLLKQEVAKEWSEKYPHYVPTGREGDFGGDYDIWDIRSQLKGNTIGAGEIQKAVGGDQPIRSIKEQLADATNRNWRDMSMNNLFRKMFGDEIGDELATYADGGLEKVLDNTVNLSKTKDGGKYFAEVFENGEMKRIEIDKRFYDAIEDLYKNGRLGNGLDVLTDAASKPAWLFKNLITSWNPIFMVKNFCRDFPEAIINSRQTKEFLSCMPAAANELATGGEYLQAFRNSGVSQANFIDLEKALTKGDKWYKKPFDKFAASQEAVETYPRLIEYMATFKKAGYDLNTGLPKDVVDAIKKDFKYDLGEGLANFRKGKKDIPDEIVKAVKDMGYDAKAGIGNIPMELRDIAAANAADVTVNFGRSGSVGKMLNKGLVPFFNPSVQGWSKFLRNFSEQESTKSFLTFAVKAAALGSGLQTINNVFLEDNPNYQQISARDKATNLIIPLTRGKGVTKDNTNVFIKIPKSRFAAVYGLPTVNIANENKIGWAEAINVVRDQVFVVDPLENNILSPLMAAKANTTWYGTPIVPKAIENKTNPSQEYDANTSWLGRQLGKATENLPTELQISPKKFDYIADAETGVIGDFGLPMMTPSKQGGGNGFEKYVKHPWGNVLKKSFTIDSVTQNNLSTRFYDKLQVATDNKDKEESKRLNGYSTEIKKINTAIRTLQNGNRKTKQEDIYGLQKVRNQMMQDAIDGKDVPSEYKAMDAVQKYVGTSYAINHFGTSADKRAMKLYGAKKYGTLSAAEQRKAINADKDFYKGVQSIGKLQGKMQKAGIDSNTTLSRAIALASVDASDDLFGAYKAQDQSRTETAHEMNRARTYFKNGGSTDEFVKLEKCRKTVGKLPEDQRKDELKKLDDEFAKGKMSYAEYDKRESEINYNADISYIGLSTSLAQANSPERGYRVYDIKDKNIQKGINLAAMGYTARDYRKMSKELDAQGDNNGYPKKQEIIDYLNKGNFNDKATLFEALYYYKGKYNPFGTPTKYTRAQAAAEGKKKGVEWITDETDDISVKEEAASGGGYRRWGRWHRWGWGHRGGSNRSQVKISPFKPSTVHPSEGGSGARAAKTDVSVKSTTNAGSSLRRASTKATLPKVSAPSTSQRARGASSSSGRGGSSGGGSGSRRTTTSTLPATRARTTGGTTISTRAGQTTSTARVSSNIKRSQARMRSGSKMGITPLNIKPVKASKSTKGYNSNLSAALKDIENTQKKVAPPKARRK